MEEKVVGGKEKKYVLYTVVGEERGRAGAGVWVVRVLLGTLLLVALAVVPYLSLRLAQVSDRTLVVFQSVPIRNHSLQHHHGDHNHHAEHSKLGHVDVVSVLKSAALTLENYTAGSNGTAKPSNGTAKPSNSTSSSSSNSSTNISSNSSGAIVTLHESAVTLAVMEDTNSTKKKENSTDGENSEQKEENSEKTTLEDAEKKESEENTTTEDAAGTSESPASVAQMAAVTADASPSTPPAALENTTGSANATVAPLPETNATSPVPITSTVAASASPSSASPQSSETSKNGSTAKPSNASSIASTVAPNTTATTSTSTSTSTRRPLAHKLVYVATTASGNHVGGFCVWKTDKTITRWSYFYENIPIEYQSHQDSSDHEMRGMLAAVRTWSPLWNDHHVVLRSHHPSIKGSDHPTRRSLTRELEKLSNGKFSYELEWRLRKTDRVVDIAYCLSRLHRDFAQWYRTFEARVDELLGPQDWTVAREQNRVSVPQGAFHTDDPDDEGVIIPGDK